ncbi:MAG: flagellar hook-associated protein 3, partial [Synergistaceae bacterium]|nr:flagellar hook-associated protein 3 [Synergistaceae bacterium]
YTQNVTTRGGANQTRQSFFGVLDDISAAVRAENRDGLSDKLLPMIDKFMDNLLKALSTNGALQVRYEGNVQRMELNKISMTEARDNLVGVDLAEISTELMMAQSVYEASLGVIAYIVQPTLLDFLR